MRVLVQGGRCLVSVIFPYAGTEHRVRPVAGNNRLCQPRIYTELQWGWEKPCWNINNGLFGVKRHSLTSGVQRVSLASVTFHPWEIVGRNSIKTHDFYQISMASLKRLILRKSWLQHFVALAELLRKEYNNKKILSCAFIKTKNSNNIKLLWRLGDAAGPEASSSAPRPPLFSLLHPEPGGPQASGFLEGHCLGLRCRVLLGWGTSKDPEPWFLSTLEFL